MSKSYYELLGVPGNATEREIKVAYHRLARKYHPDKAEPGMDTEALESEFAVISTAYNILKDPDKRAQYDKTLGAARQKAEKQAGVSGGAATKATGGTASSSSVSDASGQNPRVGSATSSLEKNRAAVARKAYARGLQLFGLGDFAKASEMFEHALKNNDADPIYHAKLAQSLLRAHRGFNRAVEAAQKAISIDPYNSEYRMLLAELYESAGIKTMAAKTYKEILKWDPTNERAQYSLDALEPPKKSLFNLFRKK